MKLWLDYIRKPWEHGCIGWEWVKTAQEAIDLLKTGRVEVASLDHDLAMEHYPFACMENGVICPPPAGYGTGFDVTLWLESNPQFWPPGGVTVHSFNPVGRERMQVIVDRHYKKSNIG